MKESFTTEFRKMIQSRTLLCSILIGMAICCINIAENILTKQQFLQSFEKFHIPGYDTLSIFQNWINGMSVTIGEQIFFVAYPLLAAIPFAWSFISERKNGYTNQILIRKTKQAYLLAKYTATFFSGGIVITAAMIFSFIVNAWFLPVIAPSYNIIGGGDSIYLSTLLFTKPMIYLLCILLTSFFLGGTLACLGLTVSLFIRTTFAAVLSPFVLFYASTVLMYATVEPHTKYEVGLMYLLHAMTRNYEPTWYVCIILFVLLAVITTVYFLRGMRDDLL